MMQIPSSNHSAYTSRRSNTSRRKSMMASWLDGFIDKACCAAAGYTAGDEVDDNSIAYSENNNNNHNENLRNRSASVGMCAGDTTRDDSSVLWEAADESIQSFIDGKKKGHSSYDSVPGRDSRTKVILKKTRQPPLSPRSDATATTVLTGSSSSSRGTRHPKTVPSVSKSYERAHSTGTMKRPEDELQQRQEQEQRRIHIREQRKANRAPREVLVPINWTHEHGLRRIQSDTNTLPKLPFQTVEPQQGYFRPKN